MHVPLGKGNLNTGFDKLFEYHKIKITPDPAPRRLAYVNPDEQLEINGVVGVFHKAYRRHVGFVNKRFILRSRQQDLFNLAWICTV